MADRGATRWSTKDTVTLAVSFIALAVSGFTLYLQHFAISSRTLVHVSTVQIASEAVEGYGDGPVVIAAVEFINAGNRPSLVSRIDVSIDISDGGASSPDCPTAGWIGTGLPWERVLDRGDWVQSAPFSVSGGSIHPVVAGFRHMPYPNSGAAEPPASYRVCLRFVMVDDAGRTHIARKRVGTLNRENQGFRFTHDPDADVPTVVID